jgi:hypothetical protein
VEGDTHGPPARDGDRPDLGAALRNCAIGANVGTLIDSGWGLPPWVWGTVANGDAVNVMLRLSWVVAMLAVFVTSPAITFAAPTTATGPDVAQAKPTTDPAVKPAAKRAAKRPRQGFGFLPGYEHPIRPGRPLRGGSSFYDGPRYWHRGQILYGYGGPHFYRGQWNGGSFGPCWTHTPIGPMWNCGR